MAKAGKRKPRDRKSAAEAFVLDCSVALAWFFADEANSYADSIARRLTDSRAVVPSHWPLEVANTLIMGERRNRSSESQAGVFLQFLRSLPIVVDEATASQAWSTTIRFAREQALTVYDAAYLELANRIGVPLATLDGRLRSAAAEVGVPTYDPDQLKSS